MTTRRPGAARILLAGYGMRGQQWHRAVQRHRRVALAGVVDPAPGPRRMAEARSLPTWPSLADAVSEADADAVIVASPPELHAELARTSLGAGLGVLVEKPLSLSLPEAAGVAAAAEAAGRPAIVGHNFRHRPQEIAVRAVLASGRLGQLRHVAVVSARPATTMRPHLREVEHAPLWDIGTHHLDLLRVRVGAVPDEVDARVVTAAGPATEATYLVSLLWRGVLTATYSHREGSPVFHHHEWLQGERAGLRIEPGRVQLVRRTSRPRPIRTRRRDRAEQHLLDTLLSGLDRTEHGSSSARDALGTVGMVAAAVRSLSLQEPVEPVALARAHEVAL
jgi:predicted dehydrogenase